jgi:peroxiredoxin
MTMTPDTVPTTHAASRRVSAREINETIRYTCWVVLARRQDTAGMDTTPAELDALVAGLAEADVTVRGLYDVSAMRPDADLMVWLHGPTPESVQRAVRRLIRQTLRDAVEVVWSAVGMHRPAEFNKGHVPAFMAGAPAQDWAVVYPFVRSHEWYLLPDADRRALLVEHGRMGREYERVLSNTVAAFALGDYEWILALEGPELHEIVDLMRHLRGSGARRHVRLETPFYPGRLVTAAEALDVLR